MRRRESGGKGGLQGGTRGEGKGWDGMKGDRGGGAGRRTSTRPMGDWRGRGQSRRRRSRVESPSLRRCPADTILSNLIFEKDGTGLMQENRLAGTAFASRGVTLFPARKAKKIRILLTAPNRTGLHRPCIRDIIRYECCGE